MKKKSLQVSKLELISLVIGFVGTQVFLRRNNFLEQLSFRKILGMGGLLVLAILAFCVLFRLKVVLILAVTIWGTILTTKFSSRLTSRIS